MRRKPRRGSSGQRGERGEAWRQSWKNSSLRPLRFSSVKSRLTIPYRARNISRPRKNSFRFRVPMQLSAKDAWKRILDEAHRELPDHTIRTWLEPTEAIALDEGRLIVGAPDQFAVEWNETKHAALLSKLAEPVVGQPTAIVFRVHEDRHKRPQMDFFVAPPAPSPGRGAGEAPDGRTAAGNPSSQALNERYSFDSFVIGKSNELAAA